jgi:hypothetical protein
MFYVGGAGSNNAPGDQKCKGTGGHRSLCGRAAGETERGREIKHQQFRVENAPLGGQTLGPGTLGTESALNDAGSEIALARSWTSLDGLATEQESRGLASVTVKTRPAEGE